MMVADFGEEPFEVLVHSFQVAALVKTLQEGLVERAQTTHFPQLTVDSVGLGHQGTETQLLVATPEMGRLVLRCAPEQLRQLRSEIDRALLWKGGADTKQ